MNVICVNHDDFGRDVPPYGPSDPQIGDICKVVRNCIGFDNKLIRCECYELEGYNDWFYDQRNFAEISDLDETTLVTEEFEEKYCVPVNYQPCSK